MSYTRVDTDTCYTIDGTVSNVGSAVYVGGISYTLPSCSMCTNSSSTSSSSSGSISSQSPPPPTGFLKFNLMKSNGNYIYTNCDYRDPELIPTIDDLLDNAHYPERLVICIAHQFSTEDKWDNLQKYAKRFKVYYYRNTLRRIFRGMLSVIKYNNTITVRPIHCSLTLITDLLRDGIPLAFLCSRVFSLKVTLNLC